MAPASTIMGVPAGGVNKALLPRLVAIWWISSMPGFHAGRVLKTGAAARRSFAGRLSNAARASELSRKRRRGSMRYSVTPFLVLSYAGPYKRLCQRNSVRVRQQTEFAVDNQPGWGMICRNRSVVNSLSGEESH